MDNIEEFIVDVSNHVENKILNEDELTKEELAKELLAAHDEVLKGNTIPFDQFYEPLKKDLKL